MYIIRERSFESEDPIYQKLPTNSKTMFIPEARVAKDYFRNAFYERSIVDWVVNTFVDEKKNCIDIGAHIGWYTMDLARKANHVYSFECSPKSFNYLCANIALNELDYKVTKFNYALSKIEGKTPYYIRDPKDGGGNGISQFNQDIMKGTPSIEVPMKTLDSFGLENVNFMKIDVEGHELQVLEGGEETLELNNYPKLLFESWPERCESQGVPARELRKKLFSFLTAHEYKITPVRGWDDNFIAERQ